MGVPLPLSHVGLQAVAGLQTLCVLHVADAFPVPHPGPGPSQFPPRTSWQHSISTICYRYFLSHVIPRKALPRKRGLFQWDWRGRPPGLADPGALEMLLRTQGFSSAALKSAFTLDASSGSLPSSTPPSPPLLPDSPHNHPPPLPSPVALPKGPGGFPREACTSSSAREAFC